MCWALFLFEDLQYEAEGPGRDQAFNAILEIPNAPHESGFVS